MATEGKTKAPVVDGKRLASLEASVSSLAIALTANGFELKSGDDPCVSAIVAIKQGKERIASLELETLDKFGGLETELEKARKRVAELETENGELHQDVEDLANARNTLANQLAAEGKGQGEQLEEVAEPEPAPIVRERPETARDVGPTFGTLTSGELQELLATTDAAFEVAFSNGDFEILEFTPTEQIKPASLSRVDGSRYLLLQPIVLKGGDHPEEIHGAGLLLEGTQVGYCPFEPPLTVQPGHEWKFDRSLIFA